jgi:4-hydroxybenzoate polyprenyltransferase
VEYSAWLLAFSLFLFLSLALVKRYEELASAGVEAGATLKGRGYVAEDLELLTPLGVTSGYISVLVLVLYVTSDQVRRLYHQPLLLLLIAPLLLYWISRLWLLAHRGQVTEDPVDFASRDVPSYAVCAAALALVWLAT